MENSAATERKSSPSSIRWTLARTSALIVAALVGILAIVEVIAFVNRTEEGARERALVEFQRLCEKRCGEVGLTSQDFLGPMLSAKTSRAYSFSWKAKQRDVEIVATVSYGPRWTESWLVKP